MSTPTGHDRLTNYLRATGWEAPERAGRSGGLWRHLESGLGMPVPAVLTEGGLDWEQILLRLAGVEGTMIIPILMPLPTDCPPLGTGQPLDGMEELAAPEPDTRRVMRTFAESLAAMDEVVITPEPEPTSAGIYDLIRAGVSHEFSSALVRILAQPSVAEFSTTFEWAPTEAPAPRTEPTVCIPSAAMERVKRVSRQLRTQTTHRGIEVLTGPVVGVHRDDADQSGVVTVQTVRNQRLAHVTINVSRERLNEALMWMRDRETVIVQGRVHRAVLGIHADTFNGVSLLRAHQLEG